MNLSEIIQSIRLIRADIDLYLPHYSILEGVMPCCNHMVMYAQNARFMLGKTLAEVQTDPYTIGEMRRKQFGENVVMESSDTYGEKRSLPIPHFDEISVDYLQGLQDEIKGWVTELKECHKWHASSEMVFHFFFVYIEAAIVQLEILSCHIGLVKSEIAKDQGYDIMKIEAPELTKKSKKKGFKLI